MALAAWCLLAGACAACNQAASIDGLEAKFVDVDGVRTRYYEYGQGEPMLLVHGGSIGGASTANNWSRNIPGLSKRFHVFAVDRLAMGMTGNPKDAAVGHSAGGGLLLYLAVEHPEVARTLTVIAHHAGIPPGDGPTKFDEILAKCPPDPTTYEHRKCRLLVSGTSRGLQRQPHRVHRFLEQPPVAGGHGDHALARTVSITRRTHRPTVHLAR